MQIVALDIEAYMEEFSRPYFAKSGLSERIEVMIGSANDSLKKLQQQGMR